MSRYRSLKVCILSASVAMFGATTAQAAPITDPAGDFLPTLFAGAPRAGDLDVLSASVTLLGTNFTLTATLNAPINTTPEAFYVWGFDRGAGATTSNFASLGLPNIVFDSVVVIQNEGTGVVNDLTGQSPQGVLAAGSTTVFGNTIQTIVPISFLTSRGLPVDLYRWNLWARWGGPGAVGNAQIADFAPNATDAAVDVVPEPGTMLLLGTGLIGLTRQAWHRQGEAA